MFKNPELIILAALAGTLFSVPAFAEAELKTYCYYGINDTGKEPCQAAQKTASPPKSGCYKVLTPKEAWCYDWNPEGKKNSIDLATLLLDPEFEDAYIIRLQDVVDDNRDSNIDNLLINPAPIRQLPSLSSDSILQPFSN